MIARRTGFIVVSFLILIGTILTDHASGAQSTKLNPLEQVIEGARKEGEVKVTLYSSLSPASIPRLKDEIKKTYDVDLTIKFSPIDSYPRLFSDAVTELAAGAPASYDLYTFNAAFVAMGIEKGLLEKVDWKPLFIKGTPPGVILGTPPEASFLYGYGLNYFYNHSGLMYNSQKIPAEKVPKTLADLADPKWQGAVGLNSYTDSWVQRAFFLGKEETFATLRQVLKNRAIQGLYNDLLNRYLLGEISMALVTTGNLMTARDKGVPTGWTGLDFSLVDPKCLAVRKNAPHPNAAKLLAAYLVSPKGYKFLFEEVHLGNLNYPGNIEFEIKSQNEKNNIPTYSRANSLELLNFSKTKEANVWSKEVTLILQTGGK
jgi:spermidine/putrescine-binding protein